jgi:hypothetical protein
MRYDWLILLRNGESSWGLESALRVKTGRFFFFEISKILKWSNCHGWPTQWKTQRFFTEMKNMMIFQSGGLIVMGDLPRWKNTKIFGEKCRDFSKWSCCNGQPARVKILEIFRRGEKHEDFPKGWKIQGFFKVVRNAKISQK